MNKNIFTIEMILREHIRARSSFAIGIARFEVGWVAVK